MQTEGDLYQVFVARRLALLQERIAAALKRSDRSEKQVRVIAVTKYVDAEHARLICSAGVSDLGENRWQVAKPKVEADLPATWHFIGPLQTNKASYVAKHFSYVHSVDRVEVAQALSRAAQKFERTLRVLLQVNISGETQKSGVSAIQLPQLIHEISSLPALSVVGLMGIATNGLSESGVRAEFRSLRRLRDGMQEEMGLQLPELSMGMSNDFELAIEEGATMVRIGRYLVMPDDDVVENPRTLHQYGVSYE